MKADTIKQLLKVHVQSTTNDVKETDRAYYPTSRDIQNYVRAALGGAQHADIDQDNLAAKIAKW